MDRKTVFKMTGLWVDTWFDSNNFESILKSVVKLNENF